MRNWWTFTGTQQGMLRAQFDALKFLALAEKPDGAGHGDCIGSDATFHMLMRELALLGAVPDAFIEIWPSDKPGKRAWCRGDLTHEAAPPLERNAVMVTRAKDEDGRVVATPALDRLTPRGGTGHTVRLALNARVPVTMIWPSGTVEVNWKPGR